MIKSIATKKMSKKKNNKINSNFNFEKYFDTFFMILMSMTDKETTLCAHIQDFILELMHISKRFNRNYMPYSKNFQRKEKSIS